MRNPLIPALILGLAFAGGALAQGAPAGPLGEPGRNAAGVESGVRRVEPGPRPATVAPGNPSPSSVPGTNPGVNIGGTPTSGPPGTGGAAGGPGIGNR